MMKKADGGEVSYAIHHHQQAGVYGSRLDMHYLDIRQPALGRSKCLKKK